MSAEKPTVPLRLRVLVKGASTVNWISPMGGPRTDFTFPRSIERELARQGRAADVRAITMTSEQTKRITLTWQREVLGFSPDAIVLVYGHFETIHLFLPRWLERHANSLRARPRRLGSFYRRRILRPLWKVLAQVQAAVDKRMPTSVTNRRLQNTANDLRTYLRQVEKVGSPLVFLFELLPPASRYRSWFPGMAARMEVMNRLLREVVAEAADPRIRLLEVSKLVEELYDGDLDRATPDGFHYTAELHDRIGIELARQIEEWAAAQGHLEVDAPSEQASGTAS